MVCIGCDTRVDSLSYFSMCTCKMFLPYLRNKGFKVEKKKKKLLRRKGLFTLNLSSANF